MFTLVGVVALMAGTWSCGDDDDDDGYSSSDICRLDPQSCDGASGTLCDDERDCNPGLICCTENSNCAGGMCTRECDRDEDCPLDMLCEHSVCFYMCDSDRDCAEGMSCEHGKTICEWP
jgi:hypothetical protein